MLSVHHIALSVTNIEASIAFYEALGFRAVFQWQADDHTLNITHMKLDDMLLELFCYAQPTIPQSTTQTLETDLPRIGVKHFGLKTDNIHQAKALLEERKIADNIHINHGRTGIDYFFIRDPDGIFVEIVQDNRTFPRN